MTFVETWIYFEQLNVKLLQCDKLEFHFYILVLDIRVQWHGGKSLLFQVDKITIGPLQST